MSGKACASPLRHCKCAKAPNLAPPSRRIIRKLRLGYSLKRCEVGFLLDCTAQRSHKTSKFYGER